MSAVKMHNNLFIRDFCRILFLTDSLSGGQKVNLFESCQKYLLLEK